MEEDIKILEENLKNGTIYVNCGNSIDKALENLLTRYKQLEEENKSKQKAYDNCYCEYKHYKQFDSIPKSKVKEKIEELDNKRRKFTSDNVNNFYLQEFTRKYTQKSDHDYGVFSTPETITYCINNELLGRVEVLQQLLERSREDE